MGHNAKNIADAARLAHGFGQGLLNGIESAQASSMIRVNNEPVVSNHPTFVFGHLSLYPAMLCQMISIEPVATPAGYEELFMHGVDCQDDPKCTIYPSLDKVVDHYNATTEHTVDALEKLDDAVLVGEHPFDFFRDRMPLAGSVAAFMLCAHPMMHFGQISAWRRFAGLGATS